MATAAQQTALATSRGIDTRSRILDEAERLFSEHGFHGVSLTGIATTCSLGNAGLLHHFPSKAKLYSAVLERVAGRLADRVTAVLADAATPRERLVALIRSQAESTVEYPQGGRLILHELMGNVDRVEHAQTLPLTGFVETFCTLIEEAQAAGVARPGPAIVLLTGLLGTLAYAQVVRPTFARMRVDDALLDDDRRWIEAVTTSLVQSIFIEAPKETGS